MNIEFALKKKRLWFSNCVLLELLERREWALKKKKESDTVSLLNHLASSMMLEDISSLYSICKSSADSWWKSSLKAMMIEI